MEALGGMNEKQRLKEFKRVAKELKSKDPSVREKAIQVAFDEPAYLVEGKGLLSLLEGVAAKKVSGLSASLHLCCALRQQIMLDCKDEWIDT